MKLYTDLEMLYMASAVVVLIAILWTFQQLGWLR